MLLSGFLGVCSANDVRSCGRLELVRSRAELSPGLRSHTIFNGLRGMEAGHSESVKLRAEIPVDLLLLTFLACP